MLTDELFALSGHRRSYQGKLRLIYAAAAGGSFYLAWNIWTFIGIVAGASLPDLTDLGLDFAIAATFIALVVPEIKTLPTLAAVITAAISSLIFSLWEFELGLVFAALLAMGCGLHSAAVKEADMTLLTILLLACITFGTRYLFLEGRLPVRLGSNVKLFLSYSGPAVFNRDNPANSVCAPASTRHISRQPLSLGCTSGHCGCL